MWPLCDIFLLSGQTHVYESKVESSDSTRGFGKHKYSQFTWISSHTLCPFMKKWKVTVSNFINKNFKWRDRVIWIFINTIIHSLGNLNQTQVQTSRTNLIRSWCTKINESIPKKEMLIAHARQVVHYLSYYVWFKQISLMRKTTMSPVNSAVLIWLFYWAGVSKNTCSSLSLLLLIKITFWSCFLNCAICYY